jgi:CRP/FNR family transcriptional regulator, anaerobic regulatory protein
MFNIGFNINSDSTKSPEPDASTGWHFRKFHNRIPNGELLFEPGKPRTLYRVEAGLICHYTNARNGEQDVIEFAFPGDIIGLGRSPVHVSTARALADTDVSVLTEDELDAALHNNNRLFFRIAQANDREFDYFRRKSLEGDLLPPLVRLANFLLAVASINASEGRDANLVPDDHASGFVAEQLQMSIDTLATALLELKQRGLIATSDKGLRILDSNGMEALSELTLPEQPATGQAPALITH